VNLQIIERKHYSYDGSETCREYKGHIIKYFVNCCGKEGIIIYSLRMNEV
jgi:hypothetical protein